MTIEITREKLAQMTDRDANSMRAEIVRTFGVSPKEARQQLDLPEPVATDDTEPKMHRSQRWNSQRLTRGQ